MYFCPCSPACHRAVRLAKSKDRFMKQFDIPSFYKSPIIGRVKAYRKLLDHRKRDFSPLKLDFGPLRLYIPRHFGFCYGVENAVEIAYRTVEQNPGKRIFLLSEMIHNPRVNEDLQSRGIRFIMDTLGKQLIPWEEITAEDIVLIPAFGTSLETEAKLREIGIQTEHYNTTCPFVERVWKTSAKLGTQDYSIIIHGKPSHEETRATFSHSQAEAPSVIVKDMDETKELAKVISGEYSAEDFYRIFAGRYSEGFDPEQHLQRVGVVNQTTMLATETQAIADYVKQCMIGKYGEEDVKAHFADTRDTLCYATNDNQSATIGLLEQPAHLAIVVGGYNSSNTTHLAELCEEKLPTYFISGADKILSESLISHFDFHAKEEKSSTDWLSAERPLDILVTSGASCPDITMDEVLHRLIALFPDAREVQEVLSEALPAAE